MGHYKLGHIWKGVVATAIGSFAFFWVIAWLARLAVRRFGHAWGFHELHDPGIVLDNHTADERAEGAAAVREHIAGIFRNNPTLRFTTRSLRVGDDFAVCEWTATTGSKEWDGVDVFPLRNGLILRKDVYSSSHRPREL